MIKLLVALCIVSQAFCNTSFENVNVKRRVSADTHVLRLETHITAKYMSGDKEYVYLIDKSLIDHLAHIQAHTSGPESKSQLIVKPLKNFQGYPAIIIGLPDLKPNSEITFTVLTAFTKVISAKPAEITQAEKQFVAFAINLKYLTVYNTLRQETSVVLRKGDILYYSNEPKPVQKIDAIIKYGPYENQPAFSEVMGKFNFESDFPFLAVRSLTRTIEVSHWGNIAVEDRVDVIHYGAKLRGSFSRLDYQRGIGHHASVASIKSVLPASARDIYYRDEIGNVSTSTIKKTFDSVLVSLQPRFPLMGGWKTHYIIGYNLPAHENLFRKGDLFALKMRFVDYIFDDQVIDEVTLRIVLPEMVTNVKFSAPFTVEQLPNEIEKTYLDTVGRTVIVIKKKNLIDDHIQEFKVFYNFSMINMLREPAMLVAAFMLLFSAIMVYVRLDFSLLKDKAADVQERVQATVDEVINYQAKRVALYQTYEDVLSSYKINKDSSSFNADFRKIEAKHKAIIKHIADLQAKLRDCWNEGADKILELQNLDSKYREQLQESISQAERAISGKLSKAQYQNVDTELSSKKLGLMEKMEVIVDSL